MQPLLVEQFKALKVKQPIGLGLGLVPCNLRATRFLTNSTFFVLSWVRDGIHFDNLEYQGCGFLGYFSILSFQFGSLMVC